MLAAAATAVPGAPKEVAAKKYVKSDKAKGRAARISTIKSKGYALWEKLLPLFPRLERWTDKNYAKEEWEQDITTPRPTLITADLSLTSHIRQPGGWYLSCRQDK